MKNKTLNIKGFLIIFLVTIIFISILKFTGSNKFLQEDYTEAFLVETENIILKDNSPEYLFYGNVAAQNQVDVISQLSSVIVLTSVTSKPLIICLVFNLFAIFNNLIFVIFISILQSL